jgi:hypothetical protein
VEALAEAVKVEAAELLEALVAEVVTPQLVEIKAGPMLMLCTSLVISGTMADGAITLPDTH